MISVIKSLGNVHLINHVEKCGELVHQFWKTPLGLKISLPITCFNHLRIFSIFVPTFFLLNIFISPDALSLRSFNINHISPYIYIYIKQSLAHSFQPTLRTPFLFLFSLLHLSFLSFFPTKQNHLYSHLTG